MKILPEYAGHECEYLTLAAVGMGAVVGLGIPSLLWGVNPPEMWGWDKQEIKPIEQPAPCRPMPQGSTIHQAPSGPVVIPKGLKIA